MKLSIISFFVLSLFMFSTCQKGDDIKDDKLKDTKAWDKKEIDKDDVKVCDWDGSKVSDPEVWEEYIIEDLITNEKCGCIVEGIVKYVKIDTDFAYVIYYGKGECDGYAHLVTYYEEDDKKETKCKIELNCDGEE